MGFSASVIGDFQYSTSLLTLINRWRLPTTTSSSLTTARYIIFLKSERISSEEAIGFDLNRIRKLCCMLSRNTECTAWTCSMVCSHLQYGISVIFGLPWPEIGMALNRCTI